MIQTKTIHRISKILLLFSCTLLLSMVFADNLLAYDINFEYIKHIMSMDTTLKHPQLLWRSVHNPIWYHLCFAFIILIEGIVSILLWLGVYQLLKNIKSQSSDFQAAKQWGLIGLLSGLILYSLVFFTIASQWFSSWQSADWNAKSASMPFIILLGLTYLIVAKADEQ